MLIAVLIGFTALCDHLPKEVDPGAEGPEVTTVNTQYTPATNNSDVVMEMGENMLMTGDTLDDDDNLEDATNWGVGEFNEFFSNCVLENMRKIKNKPGVFMPILYDYLGDHLNNEQIVKHIYKKMGIRKKRFLKQVQNFQKSCSEDERVKGNRALSKEERQRIHDKWLSHSNVTVDRRNGRDQVNIKKTEYLKRYGDIDDSSVTFSKNKRNVEIAKATRHIATKTVREIRSMLDNDGHKVSLGSVFNYRPFYVGVASEREKLECLCKACVRCVLTQDACLKC